jgi:hypothetical protein
MDLTKLSSKRMGQVRAEVKAFVVGVPNMEEWDLEGWAAVVASFIKIPPTPSQSDVRKIHAWLCEGVRAVEKGQPWSFESSNKHAVSWQDEEAEEGQVTQPARLAMDASGDLLERFMTRVCDTISTGGGYARRCAADDCRALYVPAHGRASYCSTRCSQRVRTARWRQNHPDEAQNIRREQYQKEVTRKYGPAAGKLIRSMAREG